jgi:hypothetical protein
VQAGIVPQCTSKVGFTTATRAGYQQVLSTIDPVSLSQSSNLRRGDIARMLVVDFLYARDEFEVGLSDKAFLFALLTGRFSCSSSKLSRSINASPS